MQLGFTDQVQPRFLALGNTQGFLATDRPTSERARTDGLSLADQMPLEDPFTELRLSQFPAKPFHAQFDFSIIASSTSTLLHR